MQVITNEIIIPTDVDGTLIIYDDEGTPGPGKIELDFFGIKKYVYPHTKHIELVKAFHQRGFRIEVHSGNGWQWAEQVVRVLGLENYVAEVKTKSFKYIDDKDVEDWFGQRVFIEFEK